jgi:outer membrane protein TolC
MRQAVELALKQNPDILMARLDEQKAAESVREVRDPFTPRLVAGSGLAYSSGFPMSIEGSAPSIVQAQAIQSLYNRPLSYQVAAARENARGATIDTAVRRDEVVHRVASMHIAAQRAGRISDLVRQQVSSYQKIADAVQARVEEGRELPVEARASELRVALSNQRLRALEAEREHVEKSLAVALGFDPGDSVRAVEEEQAVLELPGTEAAAIEEALSNSKEVKKLESAIQTKQLQAQGARASRLPQIDLVAQYALMARFNNYEEFFRKFQRHNGQIGMSFQLPIFTGAAAKSQAAQADLEIARLRIQINAARDRIALDARKAYQDLLVAQSARDVARLDLDVTRERLGVVLAQFEEGRAPLRQVEEMRSAEMEKWLAFYDAQQTVERARLEILRATGTIMAALQR